jgi:hypothetical protein
MTGNAHRPVEREKGCAARVYCATGDQKIRQKARHLLDEWGKFIEEDGYFSYSNIVYFKDDESLYANLFVPFDDLGKREKNFVCNNFV